MQTPIETQEEFQQALKNWLEELVDKELLESVGLIEAECWTVGVEFIGGDDCFIAVENS